MRDSGQLGRSVRVAALIGAAVAVLLLLALASKDAPPTGPAPSEVTPATVPPR